MGEEIRMPSGPSAVVRRLRRPRTPPTPPPPAVTWAEFAAERPDLAEAGLALLYQFGVGLAFLATVRTDGGPRAHPICPAVADGGLYAFLVPSPKRQDLRRDPRYALHSFPPEDNEDAIYLTGRAAFVDDPDRAAIVRDSYFAERKWEEPPAAFAVQQLVEFRIDTCMLTRTTGHGDEEPGHTVWKAAPRGPAPAGGQTTNTP